MENLGLSLGLGLLCLVSGLAWTVRNIVVVGNSRLLRGRMIDRRSGCEGGYFPVIEYELDGESRLFNSTHFSVLQKIGRSVRLVYDGRRGRIIATLGGFFFIPVAIALVGVAILLPTLLYWAAL